MLKNFTPPHLLKFLTLNWVATLKMNSRLKFKYAVKLPILCFGKFSIHQLAGKIQIDSDNIKTGMIQIGESRIGIFEKKGTTVLNLCGTIVFKGNSCIGNASSISVGKNSVLTIGENFTITAKSSIICSGRKNVTIGNNTLFSWDVLIMNNDFHPVYDSETNIQMNTPEDIFIGDNVWIGCRSVVLKGSIISNKSVIAASSVISGKLDAEGCVYSGLPIKIIKKNVYWGK